MEGARIVIQWLDRSNCSVGYYRNEDDTSEIAEFTEEDTTIAEEEISDLEAIFQAYVQIVSREGNIPVGVAGKIARLGRWYRDIMRPRLIYYHTIYSKFAPRLSHAYHRRLLTHPIEYSPGKVVRTIPVINLQGHDGGVLILNSDPPIFSDQFLNDRRPALMNICLLLNKPVEFFFKLGIRSRGILCSGYVRKSDIKELPPYTAEEIERAQLLAGDLPAESILPGRYFVDLHLVFEINPLLFHQGLFNFNDLLFLAAEHLIWHDTGFCLEPTLQPDLRIIINYFTHIIAHFRTVPTAFIEEPLAVNITNARLHALICRPKEENNAEEIEPIDFDTIVTPIGHTAADNLLDSDEDSST
jgi:hypothetical protein